MGPRTKLKQKTIDGSYVFSSDMDSPSFTQSNLNDLINKVTEDSSDFISYKPKEKPVNVTEELAKRERIKNRGMEQDIGLKRTSLILLFLFLGIETTTVFAYTYFQAVHFRGFALEEWSFKLLVASTIMQITYMLRIAIQHLFPNEK